MMYPRLMSFCMKYVQDKFIADEIVGEALLYLWERKRELNHIDNIKSYLYTIVRNKAFKHLKSVEKIIYLESDRHDYFSDSDNENIIEEEVQTVLLSALETLPVKCRRVFELSCLKGLKYKEIAEDMNISVNTVKSQRARAIELLKTQLKDKSEDRLKVLRFYHRLKESN